MRIRKTINVSKKDIETGVKATCASCPVALALTRVLGRKVAVTGPSFRFWEEDQTHSLPPKVWKFVDDFDHGRPVQPFAFTLLYNA